MTSFFLNDSLGAPFPQSARLKERQKDLLRKLVRFIQGGQLKEPIVPFPLGEPSTHYVIYLQGEDGFRFKRISDMDALCDADYMTFRWNRVGTTKLYAISKAGYQAAVHGFHIPPSLFGTNTNLSELLTVMSGGSLEVKGLAEHLDFVDIALDPVMRHDTVQLLVSTLIQEAEAELPWHTFVAFNKKCIELREELLRGRPDLNRLKSLAAALTLPDDWTAPFVFGVKAWAILYPLLLLSYIRSLAVSKA